MAQERDRGGLRVFGWLTESRIETTKSYEKRSWSAAAAIFLDDFFGVLLLGYCFGCTIDSRNS